MYTIYRLTCKTTGKSYIGMTGQKLCNRFSAGGHVHGYKPTSPIGKAIIEYGWQNFEKAVLDTTDDKKHAEELEDKYISMYNSISNGYNVHTGGINHYRHSEEEKTNHSNKLKGHKVSEETRKKMSESAIKTWKTKRRIKEKES